MRLKSIVGDQICQEHEWEHSYQYPETRIFLIQKLK